MADVFIRLLTCRVPDLPNASMQEWTPHLQHCGHCTELTRLQAADTAHWVVACAMLKVAAIRVFS